MTELKPTGTFEFKLVSPEEILVSEPVHMAVIPGAMGAFGVLPKHSPLLSSLLPGVVTLTRPDGEEEQIFVAGGFADVNVDQCTVLAEEAIAVKELSKAEIEQEISNLQEDLARTKDAHGRTKIEGALAIAQAKQDAIA